ncbi:host specificity factor TipJ family phage tail protein [Sporomusa sp.]|uniref:host specificity factor TipJ family phage tail protein n=1 Tax=Sporomusa sp. TaxID=2078658 RepID=UPI002BF99516|nr:host specificity factor TipJ family phage tail protein [Sporomusa sp.]HWR09896.1 host specificity factor TipJ family phage tail protein [Sporomusa sp.]
MITITVLKNPFNHTDKEIHTCEPIPGKTAYEYIQPYIMGLDEYVVSIGGNVVDNDKEQHVNDEDWLAVCPVVGKSGRAWFRAIASIALSIAVGDFSASLGGKFWAKMAAGAVSAIGGTLINHWFPAAKADRYEINPSYNWSNAQPLTDQGNALAVTYGTMRTAGQVLAQHVSSDGDNQYLNLLLCGGEGLIDSISDIRINDNPISYYKDIIIETRLGDNDQTAIANFNDTYIDQALAYEINGDDTWVTQQTAGNALEGLEVTLEFPYGLYYAKDSGGLGNAAVTLQTQYRKVGEGNWRNLTDGMSWTVTGNFSGNLKMISVSSDAPTETWTITYVGHDSFSVSGSVSGVKLNAHNFKNYNNGLIVFNITEYRGENSSGFELGDTFTIHVTPNINLQIEATKNTSFFRTYRVDNLPSDQYEVRVKCIAKSGTSNRYSTRVFWTQMSNIIYDDFARPGKVLVGIKALATNQLSGGMPSITWLQTRSMVWVWNADSGQYEQKPATNPAWAAYDMIHRCRQIKNIHTGYPEFSVKGTPATRAVYQDFARWAAFCDSQNLTFNYIFNTATDLWTSLQKPESVGRGKVIMRGTRYGCVCDAPGEPVQLFTVGNILTDKFQETFVGLKDRANAIEATFVNKDKAYQKEVITAYADDYDNTTEPNITQITLDGVTTVAQAYREAKYRLRLNQYLQRTVEHSADIDAITCQINDVVLLAHDVPQWGYSGRLLAATATTLQMDREVTLRPGKAYTVALQITNPAATTAQEAQSIVTVGVQGVVQEISTDTVTLTSPLSHVPQQWDLYSFGETSKVVKPFRVLSISRDQDLRRKISCIEYIEAVYTEATDIPTVNYSALETTTEVSSVSVAEETYRQKDGTIVSNLNVAWSIPRNKLVLGYAVLYSSDNGSTWIEWTTKINALSTTIIGVKTQNTYLVKVCTINTAGIVSTGVTASPVLISGKDAPPSDVAAVTAKIDSSNCSKVQLSWSPVADIDLSGYRLAENGSVITATPISDTQYTYTAKQTRPHNFKVWAVDNSGNLSLVPAAASINVTIGPAQVAGFNGVQKETDRSRLLLSWTANAESDISYYEIRKGSDWDTAAIIATQLKATMFEYTLTTEGSTTFLIKAFNVAGYGSELPAAKILQINLRPNTPANGSIVQDINDKSVLLISWAAVTDKDLKEYEIRMGTAWSDGTVITTTKETNCRYKLTDGGVYHFMVCSRNVADKVSSTLNLSVSANLSPSNVTDFAVDVSATDRRVLDCSWSAVPDTDLSHYEIRQGTNWDTAAVVASRIKGNFCSLQFTGGSATFLIKAVNISNTYSEAAASYNVVVASAPNIPGAGSAIADPNNRLKLTVAWGAVTDADLAGYEVRLGNTWAAGITITTTKETACQYTVATGGTVTFLVAAKTIGGQYSSPRTITTIVKQEPGDIASFNAMQNALDRRIVNLAWSAVPDTDLLGYEIRKGAVWDSATVVATGVKTTKYDYPATIEETATFLVKAISAANKYSATAKSVILTVRLQPNASAAGTITQDENNSAIQVLAWSAVDDADVVLYEIRQGANWDTAIFIGTTRELTYRYTAVNNTPLNFCIAAKNVGGYYSPVLRLTALPNINPQDVTGFSVSQQAQDHSKVRLSWSAVTNKDFSYYEIRQGISWDTGTVVATRITGLYFDANITSEDEYTYWIRAFNTAGKGSLNPTGVSSMFSMNPSTPAGLTVVTDPNDKTKISIAWNSIADQDLKEYELRAGITWDDDDTVIITKTKETKTSWYPPVSLTYHFMLAARNHTNWISDIAECNFDAYIEPNDVNGLYAMQNGSNVLMVWDKIGEADVVGYEIREGGSFDNGSLVTTGINTLSYQLPVDTEKTYRYWIKAINRAGKYSQQAVNAEVTIAGLPPKNIVEEFDEITLQSGSHTNTEFGPSLINMSNMRGRFSDYPTTKFSDVGGQTVLKLKSANLIQDGNFQTGVIGSQWLKAGTGTLAIVNGSLRLTAGVAGTNGLYYDFPQTLSNGAVYVIEFAARSSKALTLGDGFTGQNGAYAQANVTPASGAAQNLTTAWQVFRREYTIGATGTDPGKYLFNYGTYAVGDWSELNWARIYKKTDEGLFLVDQWGGGYYPSGEYVCVRKDLGQRITANISSQFVSTVLHVAGVNAKLQFRTSQDGTIFTEWADFSPVLATFRYIDFKVLLSTADPGQTPEVNILKAVVDVPDTDKAGTAAITAGGTTVNYGYTYWDYPAVVPTAIGAGLRAELQSVGKSSFTVKVLNTAGAAVGGQITWIAKGY